MGRLADLKYYQERLKELEVREQELPQLIKEKEDHVEQLKQKAKELDKERETTTRELNKKIKEAKIEAGRAVREYRKENIIKKELIKELKENIPAKKNYYSRKAKELSKPKPVPKQEQPKEEKEKTTIGDVAKTMGEINI